MAGAGPSLPGNRRRVESCLHSDGSWADSMYFCCPAPVSLDPEEYFRSYDVYYKEKGICAPVFDSVELHRKWGGFESLKYPSSFQRDRFSGVIHKAFQIGNGYEWRPATAGERLYSRTKEGYYAVPVEHFKAGLRPKPHRFLIALFKQKFKCSVGQFSPNAIRLILWYIAACVRRGYQPTFKAFFTIFSVKKSSVHPFYELYQCNKTTKLGKLLFGFKPVLLPDSMKNWQHEFVMLRGGEWEYMPGFNDDYGPNFSVPKRELSVSVLESLRDLIKTFKPWEKSKFYFVETLKHYRHEIFNKLVLCHCTLLDSMCFSAAY